MNNSTLNKKQLAYLILLASINFTHIMDFMIMMPMAPQLMRVLKIGPQPFSLLVASYTISAGVASFFGTFLVDRFDRKRVLLFCYAGFIVGTALCGLANQFAPLLAARIFTGLLGGVIGSQVLSIVGDLIPVESRGKATGLVMTGFSAASVLGVPVGLYLSVLFSWKYPFFLIAFLGVLVWLLTYFFLPPIRQHLNSVTTFRSPYRLLIEILKIKKHRLALLFTILIAFSHFTMIPFLSPYMVANVGFKEIELNYIYIIGGALTLVTGPYIGKLADQFGLIRVFTALVIIAIIPQLAITNMPAVSIWIALIFTAMFFIFSGGRFVPSQALTIGAVLPAYRGGFMSLNASVMQLASGLAAFLAGLIVVKNSAGQMENYWVIGVSTVIFSVLALLVAPKLKA